MSEIGVLLSEWRVPETSSSGRFLTYMKEEKKCDRMPLTALKSDEPHWPTKTLVKEIEQVSCQISLTVEALNKVRSSIFSYTLSKKLKIN